MNSAIQINEKKIIDIDIDNYDIDNQIIEMICPTLQSKDDKFENLIQNINSYILIIFNKSAMLRTLNGNLNSRINKYKNAKFPLVRLQNLIDEQSIDIWIYQLFINVKKFIKLHKAQIQNSKTSYLNLQYIIPNLKLIIMDLLNSSEKKQEDYFNTLRELDLIFYEFAQNRLIQSQLLFAKMDESDYCIQKQLQIQMQQQKYKEYQQLIENEQIEQIQRKPQSKIDNYNKQNKEVISLDSRSDDSRSSRKSMEQLENNIKENEFNVVKKKKNYQYYSLKLLIFLIS